MLPAVAAADTSAAPQPFVPSSTSSSGSSEELRLRASAPPGAEAKPSISLSELGPEIARSGRSASVAVPIVADDELLGLVTAEGTSEVDLARAVANQTAVAIKKIELIERLTEKNLIKDFFEQLAGGNVLGAVEGRAARLGCDLDRKYLVVEVGAVGRSRREGDRDSSARLPLRPPRRLDPRPPPRPLGRRGGARRPNSGRPRRGRRVRSRSAISNACQGASSFQAGFEEAGHALLGSVIRGAPGVMTYEELGPYKYLLRMSFDSAARDSQRDAGRQASPSTTASADVAPPHARGVPPPPRATSAPRPRRSTSTRTRCASGCGGFRSSPGSTCARTTGSWSRSP